MRACLCMLHNIIRIWNSENRVIHQCCNFVNMHRQLSLFFNEITSTFFSAIDTPSSLKTLLVVDTLNYFPIFNKLKKQL